MARVGGNAVVLGASMAGMVTARVLSDFYRTVTVVDRDVLPPDEWAPRRGVPQGRHAHALTAGGGRVIGELFPGLLDELEREGVPVLRDGNFASIDMTIRGHRIVRSGRFVDTSVAVYSPSRPFLEYHVRRRLRAIANVTILDGHDVLELTATGQSDRIDGVTVVPSDQGPAVTLSTDLIVDATGRGSRTPAFLEHLGFERPAEEEVVMRMAYSSQLLRMEPGALTEHLVNVFPVPGRSRLAACAAQENNTRMLTVGGMLGVDPPTGFVEMLDFIEDFMPEYAMAALRAADPVGEVARYRVPSSRWRRYDKLRTMPKGLLVTGDAICSFDPIYGQGMTVAALEAIALRDCLADGDHKLPQRFSTAAAKIVRVAWQMAAGSDLALPGVEGRRTPAIQLTNWFTDKVLAAAEADTYVAEKFVRTAGFIDPPTALLRPSVLRRVFFRRAGANSDDTPPRTANLRLVAGNSADGA